MRGEDHTSTRISLLNQMRQANEAAQGKRSERLSRAPGHSLRLAMPFENLEEYQAIEVQRRIAKAAGIQNPFYRAHHRAAGATTLIGNREYTNFASYDYLGANSDERIQFAAKLALEQYGVSASASRLVAGERPIHGELETSLAGIYGVDAAICFVSGYLTNMAAISTLVGPLDLVIHDEYMHNSAIAGIKQSGAHRRYFKHNDLTSLNQILAQSHEEYRRVLVVAEGVYSMDGDIADLPGLLKLRDRYGFWLMVDEAHALGVLGSTGKGSHEHFAINPKDVDIWMGTLSKTAASCGGYIAGSQALVDILRANAGGFVYSVGLSPVLAAAAVESLSVLKSEPYRVRALQKNGALFLQLAKNAGLPTGYSEGVSIVPIIVGDSLRAIQLSNDLLDEGINVLPIIYPAVQEGMARLRFFITADHTNGQLEKAVASTAEHLKRLQASGFGLGKINITDL